MKRQLISLILLLFSLAPVTCPYVFAQENPSPVTGNQLQRRMDWFYKQRADPLGHIPGGARSRALEQLRQNQAKKAARREVAAGTVGAATGQWTLIGPQPTNTPFPDSVVAGRVSALAVDPRDANVVYLGAAQGGVWKTTDGGATWTPLTDTQASLATGSIALDPTNPDTVYVGTGEENFSGDSYYGAGILKSTDGGATWAQIAGPFVVPFGGSARIGSLAVHPTNSQILLAAAQSNSANTNGIFRSTDGGATWTQTLRGNGVAGTSVLFDPSNGNVAYAALGGISGSPSNGVYISNDSGQTWSPDNGSGTNALPSTNIGRIAMALAPSTPSTLYVGIQNTSPFGTLLGFFKTIDGGQNWMRIASTTDYCTPQCWYDNVVAVHPFNPDIVCAGGGPFNTLIRSLDGGSTWTTISAGGVLHVDMHALAFSGDATTLYIGNDGGVWSTTDTTANPVNFTQLNTSLAITQFYPGMSIHPTDPSIAFGGTQDNGTQRFSGVLPWLEVTCGDGGWTAIDSITPSTVYATCQNIAIMKSTSNGDPGTWRFSEAGINTTDNVEFIPPFVMDPSNSQTLYFGTNRVYQTNDGASSWSAISPSLGVPLTTIAVAPGDSNTVYAGTSSGHVWVTTNASAGPGALWSDQSAGAGFPFATITQIAVDPNASATAYVTFSGFNLKHAFQTTDGGLNWKDISGDLPNIPVNDIVIDPDQAAALYLATDLGVFQTTDGGTTWNPLGGGLPNVAVLGLKLHEPSRTLRAATHGRSAWDFLLGPASPSLSISPAELKFKDRLIGTTSAARTVTVFNTTTNGIVLTVTSVSISGTNSNDFNIVTNTCTTPVVPGASCSIQITFSPTHRGERAATLNISDNASDSPQAVSLLGKGHRARQTTD